MEAVNRLALKVAPNVDGRTASATELESIKFMQDGSGPQPTHPLSTRF
jgi:hypothetical protein